MRGLLGLYRSSVGKKIAMALSGLVLVGFVFGHMVGNLKIYQGPEKYDAYAEFLRHAGSPLLGTGQALWLARIFLLACIGIHIYSAAALTRMSYAARGTGYRKKHDLSFSYASRTMRWGGVLLAAFVIYHLLHLTLGTVHSDFEHGRVYDNVVGGFRSIPVSVFYILCMIPLGLHLYHGLWSITQTLSLDNPNVIRVRRSVSAVVALAVLIGNISIPVAALAGWL